VEEAKQYVCQASGEQPKGKQKVNKKKFVAVLLLLFVSASTLFLLLSFFHFHNI
jgi:hypothetical protein